MIMKYYQPMNARIGEGLLDRKCDTFLVAMLRHDLVRPGVHLIHLGNPPGHQRRSTEQTAFRSRPMVENDGCVGLNRLVDSVFLIHRSDSLLNMFSSGCTLLEEIVI